MRKRDGTLDIGTVPRLSTVSIYYPHVRNLSQQVYRVSTVMFKLCTLPCATELALFRPL